MAQTIGYQKADTFAINFATKAISGWSDVEWARFLGLSPRAKLLSLAKVARSIEALEAAGLLEKLAENVEEERNA